MAKLTQHGKATLRKQVPKALKNPFRKIIQKRFDKIKKEMIEEFLQLYRVRWRRRANFTYNPAFRKYISAIP